MTGLPECYAGSVMRRNGAYLIELSDQTGDLTPDALFDAAASFPVAKRVLRRLAGDHGFVGRFRWVPDRNGLALWSLYAARWDYGE